MTKTEQLIEKLKEYIEFLGKELDKTAVFLHVHNMDASQDVVNQGIILRSEIATLEAELAVQKPVKDYPIPEYFVKVYIKSESDLPKVTGIYYVHLKTERDDRVYIKSVPNVPSLNKGFWMDNYDWYLKPVDALPKTEFKPVKSAETSQGIKRSELWEKIYSIIDRLILAEIEGDGYDKPSITTELEKMLNKEYASQFKTDLREELLLFAEYINKIGWSIPKDEVEQFLKTKQ